LDELEQGFEAVEDAQRVGRGKLRAGSRDGQLVGLVLAELLDLLAGVVCMDKQRGVCCRRFGPERDAGLPRKLGDKSLDAAVEGGIVKSGDGDGEGAVDEQVPRGWLDRGGHGHDGEGEWGLGSGAEREEEQGG
jgi:hypothetical protein